MSKRHKHNSDKKSGPCKCSKCNKKHELKEAKESTDHICNKCNVKIEKHICVNHLDNQTDGITTEKIQVKRDSQNIFITFLNS